MDNINIYDNYTNYLYEVETRKNIIELSEKRYVLFNPSIHYWISLDEIGKEIYTCVKEYHELFSALCGRIVVIAT